LEFLLKDHSNQNITDTKSGFNYISNPTGFKNLSGFIFINPCRNVRVFCIVKLNTLALL
jgi:hypothetical protein